MIFFSKAKNFFARFLPCEPSIDEIDLSIYGLDIHFHRKLALPVPHEVSIFVPRLEFTKKFTENGKTTETSVVLNSLTLVSAPRHEPTGHPAKVTANKPQKILLS